MSKKNDNISSVKAGFQGYHILKVIPRVELVFDEPDSTTVQKITNPDSFTIPVPIKGTCKNIFKDVSCEMWWIIERGEPEPEPEPELVGPLPGMIKLDSADKFHIEINGATPEVDILKLRLFDNGVLKYRIAPAIPRAKSYEMTSTVLAYSVPLSVDFSKCEKLEIGSRISVTPGYPRLFDTAGAVRIVIKEMDEGDGEYTSTTATGSFSYTWTQGNRKPCVWMIGFSRADGGILTYPEAFEQGDYEFGYELQVSSDEKEFVTVRTQNNKFTGIKRPRVDSFKLVFEKNLVYAKGKISGFASGTAVPLELFLKKEAGRENTIRYGNQIGYKKVDPDENGEFKTLLFNFKPMAKAGALPDSNCLFAMMKPSTHVWSRAFETPVFQAIDYDEKIYAGLDEIQEYVAKYRAMWICSEEQKNFVVVVDPDEARIRAFLRVIRVGEGTSDETGYEKLFGGQSFINDYKKSWNAHPQVKVSKGKYTSSAAGAYQILDGTWNDASMKKLRDEYNVADFSPQNQDKMAIIILKHKRMTKANISAKYENAYGDIIQMIIDNDIDRAILTASLEWASLPGSPYGQPMRTLEEVKKDYDSFLLEELEMKTTLHIAPGFLKGFGYK